VGVLKYLIYVLSDARNNFLTLPESRRDYW
jgi:hypothetical protein